MKKKKKKKNFVLKNEGGHNDMDMEWWQTAAG